MILIHFTNFLRDNRTEYIYDIIAQKISEIIVWPFSAYRFSHIFCDRLTNVIIWTPGHIKSVRFSLVVLVQWKSHRLSERLPLQKSHRCTRTISLNKINNNNDISATTDCRSQQDIRSVLGKELACSINVSFQDTVKENDPVGLTCTMEYSGNWAPVMRWQQDGGPVITAGVVNNTVPYKSVTSGLVFKATNAVNDKRIICTTYFDAFNLPSSTNAVNVPVFSKSWKSPTINVALSNHTTSSQGKPPFFSNYYFVLLYLFTICLFILLSYI